MALPTSSLVSTPTPQVIGKAFMEQYYHILHQSPEMVHKFYQDSSILNRPGSDGEMTSVTTMQEINEKIMSFDLRNCFTEIETADSEFSYQNGVLIVVTGTFTGPDNVRQKFAQSFFLAPQENGGYFVLNDVFRFLSETHPREENQIMDNDSPVAPETPETVLNSLEHHDAETIQSPLSEDADNEEVLNQSEDGGSAVEDEVALDPPATVGNSDPQPGNELIDSVAQDDVPKKSYASIVKVMKGNPTPVLPNVTYKVKATPEVPKETVDVPIPPSEVPEADNVPASNVDPERNSILEEEGHSIYIGNLSLNATAEQVEEEFKKFGPIKSGGVQVRSNKVDRYCFGFVEFESRKSMQAALEASPVNIGGRPAIVQEKRTTTRVVNGVVTYNGNANGGRGRFQLGRGGYRTDNFRGRGGFTSNMGYRRNEFRNRTDYAGRGWGQAPSRGNDGYQQRAFYNGNGMNGRPRGPKPAAAAA